MNILNQINSSEPNSNTTELDEILRKYPYFAIGHILKAKNTYQTNQIKFDESLNNAALYSINRSALFKFIYQEEYFKVIQPILKTEKVDTEQREVKIEIPEKEETQIDEKQASSSLETKDLLPITEPIKEAEKVEIPLEEILDQNKDFATNAVEVIELTPEKIVEIKSEDDLKTRVLARLGVETNIEKPTENTQDAEIIAKPKRKSPTKKTKTEESVEPVLEPEVKSETKKSKKKEKTEIIETFIKINPSVSRPTDQDYSETVEQANKSLEENFDFVSETLAEIYLQQGNKAKAIKIFQQLSLKYPEKKRYFAAQIKKIE